MNNGKNTAKYHKTKRALDDAVRRLIDTVGIDNLTVEDICKEAQLTRSNFYYYYKNKDDAIVNRFGVMDAYYLEKVAPTLTHCDTAADLRIYVGAYLKLLERMRFDYIRRIHMAQLACEADWITSPERGIHRVLRSILEESHAQNCLLCDVDTVYELVLTFMRGVSFKWCMYDGRFPLYEEGMKEFELILRGIGAEKAPNS